MDRWSGAAQRGLFVGAAALAAVSAQPAMAHTVPDNLSPSLTYAVSGFVTPKCELTIANSSVDIEKVANPSDDTIAAVDVALPFDVTCNAAVRVAMTSQNGGLKFRGTGTSDPAFSDLIPYQARVDVPGRQNILSCTSELMASDRAACQRETDGIVGSGSGAVRVKVAPAQGLLLAGQYADRLTITIAPQLGGEDR